MTLYVIVSSFLKPGTLERIPGGTETYTDALSRLTLRGGGKTVVLQKAISSLDCNLDGSLRVIGWSGVDELRTTLTKLRQQDRGVVVMYQPFFWPRKSDHPCVLVQHGIGGDGTADPRRRGCLHVWLADVRRRYRAWRGGLGELGTCAAFTKVICVDTNYINQVRANHPMYDLEDRLTYIPNFADAHSEQVIEQKWILPDSPRFIVLFARRFELHRGVYLWADCVDELRWRFPEVEFRFVGYGVGENRIKQLVTSGANVKMYARSYDQMPAEYAAAHISVVPSLWSEGTSLSCIESMAAGCAIVVSNVGGLGNLVIPDYNGLILSPTVIAFRNAVGRLLQSRWRAVEMAKRGYDLARTALSRQAWDLRVGTLLKNIAGSGPPGPFKRRFKPV